MEHNFLLGTRKKRKKGTTKKLELKRKFVRFIMEKVYFTNFSPVQSFIADGENIFNARSRIPGTFLTGILLTLFYTGVFTFFAFLGFKKNLYLPPVKEAPTNDNPPITVNGGEYKAIHVLGEDLQRRIYNILSGKRTPAITTGFSGKLIINSTDITEIKEPCDFLYLCPPPELPLDLEVKSFVTFIKKINPVKAADQAIPGNLSIAPRLEPISKRTLGELNPNEVCDLAMYIIELTACDFYLLDNISNDMTAPQLVILKDLMESRARQGRNLLLLSSKLTEAGPAPGHQSFHENTLWSRVIEHYREKKY